MTVWKRFDCKSRGGAIHVGPTSNTRTLSHPNPVIRIALVGRQSVVLDSLRNLIAGEPDLLVLGDSAEDGSTLTTLEQADIALFDLDEADDEVLDGLQRTAQTIRTIVLSISDGAAISLRVFQAGAMGLFSKRYPPALLLKAIRKVHAGEAWLGRTISAQLIELARAHRQTSRVASGSAALTARERLLIALVGEGWKNADIARYLVASEATVRASLTSIFRKLDVPNRFALMIYASQHGYVIVGDKPRQRAVLP